MMSFFSHKPADERSPVAAEEVAPEPVAETAAPVADEPAPVSVEPAPVADEPAPVSVEPVAEEADPLYADQVPPVAPAVLGNEPLANADDNGHLPKFGLS